MTKIDEQLVALLSFLGEDDPEYILQADADDIDDDQPHEPRLDAEGWPVEAWCDQCGQYHPVETAAEMERADADDIDEQLEAEMQARFGAEYEKP